MKPIAYYYEAGIHCRDCTALRFPPDQHGNSYGTDREGNEIQPIFSWADCAVDTCDDCRAPILAKYGYVR